MNTNRFFPTAIMIVLPVLFALTLPIFFKLQVFTEPQQLVSILGMILLPFSEGVLLMLTSSTRRISKASYRTFSPWIAILVFFAVTFLFQLEECACWIIGLPVYLLIASIGGLTAGYLRLKNQPTTPNRETINE